MNKVFGLFGLRFTTGHAIWAAVLIPACILLFLPLDLLWLGITLAVIIALAAVLTIRGRRLTGWVAAVFAWRRRHRNVPDLPSEPAVGATVMPGDHVAVRWQDGYLVSAIELVPAAVHPDGDRQRRGLHRRRRRHPAGRAIGRRALPGPRGRRRVGRLPGRQDRARQPGGALRAGGRALPGTGQPAYLDRAEGRARTHAQVVAAPRVRRRRVWPATWWRRPLVSQISWPATVLMRDPSAASTIFDRATEISFERETWSTIKGRSTFTAAYSAAGGPDVWWSARADHTITRVRIRPGAAPTTTVLLTTLANPTTPRGFSCLFGGQRAALHGISPVTDRHYELPIGSAGVLVGETADRYPVYMPFDDVDVSINLGDARLFTQFVVRSAAAGAVVTLGPQFGEFAGLHQRARRAAGEGVVAQRHDIPRPASGHRAGSAAAQLHRHAAAPAAADPVDQSARGKPLPDGAGGLTIDVPGCVERRYSHGTRNAGDPAGAETPRPR